MKKLGKFHPEELIADSEKNMKDIRLYIRDALKECVAPEELMKVLPFYRKNLMVYLYMHVMQWKK